ncbi:hypothetical protein [Pararhodobacter oceanensis]|uniref:Uncharacterized protein n=1 Tax=Pararhodobacter oceanensis TaxID=2172121 RepID=A0A2T8HXH7_9RHOB|nr:hypothetical protein [Pararhodobacter oceanensis]PVH30104.1 hypothetical protein DDE20_00590 [Pararhodobacter oceanensis]
MTLFQLLIWIGAAVTLAGVVGLLATGVSANKLRNSGLPDDEMRRRLQSAVHRNMAALFVAVIGLMMVIIGIALG